MNFTAVGDLIIQKRIFDEYEGFEELGSFIRQGDGRFFNLETTLNNPQDVCASQFSGGTYIRTQPEVLDDAKKFGFNMVSFNNNHAFDFFYSGFNKTLETVEKSGLVHSGAGRNLFEASRAKYLETPNGRVALISVNTQFNPTAIAGEQSPLFEGRPGINGLRINRHIELPQKDIDYIKEIAKDTNINAAKEIFRGEGYYPYLADNEAELGELKFITGETRKVVDEINKDDIKRVEKTIYEAKLQADYIMLSVHCHHVGGTKKENPPKFLEDFAHLCIDMGVNAVVGHGPHLMQPIEIYKGCPIFYSLGDFILQLYNVELAPQEFFEKIGLNAYESTVHELIKTRSKNFTVGLMEDRRMLTGVIPYWETKDGKLTKIKLMPYEIVTNSNKSRNGLPRFSKDEWIYNYLKDMCKPYGTDITLEDDGCYLVKWN